MLGLEQRTLRPFRIEDLNVLLCVLSLSLLSLFSVLFNEALLYE